MKGEIDHTKPTLVRMHALNVFADLFAEMSQRGGLLEGAMRIIGEEGSGVIVLINRPMPNFISTTLKIRAGQVPLADASQLRDYGVGAQILNVLGVHDMVLLMKTYPQFLGIGLDESTAIVVQGHVAEVMGPNQVHIYNRRKPVVEGQPDHESYKAGARFDLKERKALAPNVAKYLGRWPFLL